MTLSLLLFACAPDAPGEVEVVESGLTDEPVDADGDGFLDTDDCDDGRDDVYPGADELADFVDNDCDGVIDDGTERYDDDGDGFTELTGDCDDADAAVHPDAFDEAYDGIDQDCSGSDRDDLDGDGSAFDVDCDDDDASVHPGAEELADGLDNDCNGEIDEGTVNDDLDGDGWSAADGDCDEDDPGISPGAVEIAYDGIDQDCSGHDLVDVDGDGYNGGEGERDCDDEDPEIHPAATDVAYNGIDEDCTGSDLTDVDGDGHDALEVGGDDCDDSSASAYPGGVEVGDGFDNDCNGQVDEGTTWGDDDGDGYAEIDGDCDDERVALSPQNEELAGDGLDNDCNGLTDELSLDDQGAWTGSTASDSFGAALALGDFDGDGGLDLAVGAARNSDGLSRAGHVYVISADAANGVAASSASFSIVGRNNSESFGTSLATVPDLDGDFDDELLVGATGLRSTTSNEGGAYLIAGGADWGLVDSAIGDAFATGRSYTYGGNAVAAGDLDGDGTADLVVAANEHSSSQGRVWVVAGDAPGSWISANLSDVAFADLEGQNRSDLFGEVVAVLPDTDGDGYDELAIRIGAEGAVALFDGDELDDARDGSDAFASFTGDALHFGGAFAGADLDGDGDTDLVVGAQSDEGALHVYENTGSGWSGSQGADDTTASIYGEDANDNLGTSVAIGDADGDGLPDVLVGAPSWSGLERNGGAVFVLAGGSVFDHDGATVTDVATAAVQATAGGAGTVLVAGDEGWAAGTDGENDEGAAWLVLP